MAWLYGDSYDGYQDAGIVQSYDATSAATISLLHGQCSSQSLKLAQSVNVGYVVKGVNAGDARTIGGVAAYVEGGATLFILLWGGTPVFQLYNSVDGSLVAYYNPDAAFPPVSFVTAGGILPLNRLTYIEWDILLGASGTGEARIWVDGATTPAYEATGLSTAWPGEAQYTGFKLGGGTQGNVVTYFDSLYLLDGTGPAPWNARLGHVGAHALLATGAGTHTDFTVIGPVDNWEVSSTNDPDPDTRYVSSSTVNAQDSYEYSNLPLISGTEIFCVQTRVLAVEDTAGSREIDAGIVQSGTDYLSGAPLGVPTTDPGYLIYPMVTNPATSAQWTVNDVNADQFLFEVTT